MFYSHPLVVKSQKELHYFDNLLDVIPNAFVNDSLQAATILEHYQQKIKWKTRMTEEKENFVNPKEANFYVDATPEYLFFSSFAPSHILCTTPWIKTVSLLRNPVDRAYSYYDMMVRKYWKDRARPFEEIVGEDIRLLRETGVFRDFANQSEFDLFAGSEDERVAWMNYTSFKSHRSVIGKGLYAIQVGHWLEAFDKFNKPRSDWLFVQSEQLKTDKVRIYRQILKHVGLPYQPPELTDVHTGSYSSGPMNETTRQILQDLFRPYNKRLKGLLGQDWDGVWE
jgi:hypothetical protein